jgi:hypothetical protein
MEGDPPFLGFLISLPDLVRGFLDTLWNQSLFPKGPNGKPAMTFDLLTGSLKGLSAIIIAHEYATLGSLPRIVFRVVRRWADINHKPMHISSILAHLITPEVRRTCLVLKPKKAAFCLGFFRESRWCFYVVRPAQSRQIAIQS